MRRVVALPGEEPPLRLVAETTGGAPPELKAIIAKVGERLDQSASRTREEPADPSR